jgi:hypothetical protein
MYTEDEAKTHWCPFTQVAESALPGHMVGNRGARQIRGDEDAAQLFRCLASRCAAWRWDPLTRYQDEPGKVRDVSGYCGLAGKP